MTDNSPDLTREADEIVRQLRKGPKREVRLAPMPVDRRDAIIRNVRTRLLKDR